MEDLPIGKSSVGILGVCHDDDVDDDDDDDEKQVKDLTSLVFKCGFHSLSFEPSFNRHFLSWTSFCGDSISTKSCARI